jgi:hypothetical protein
VVPRDPSAVFRWVENHSPVRFRAPDGEFDSNFFGEGEGEGEGEGAMELPSRSAYLPGGRGVLGSTLTVWAAHLPGGRSAVRVDAFVRWVKPRLAGERVPDGVTQIELRIQHPGELVEFPPEEAQGKAPLLPASTEGVTRSLTIEKRRRVAQIVRLADRLRVIQSVVPACPRGAIKEPGVALPWTFDLLFESASGLVLAEASQHKLVSACGPMTFTVRGKKMPPLEGGAKVLRALIPERRRAVR